MGALWALTSRPPEASHAGFLDDMLVFFGYPSKSREHLLAGTLWMRFFSFTFSGRKPTWNLPEVGQVATLISAVDSRVGSIGARSS